jgi:hypothetical protein
VKSRPHPRNRQPAIRGAPMFTLGAAPSSHQSCLRAAVRQQSTATTGTASGLRGEIPSISFAAQEAGCGPSRRPWPLAVGSGCWGSSAATVAPGPQGANLRPGLGGNYEKGDPVAIPSPPKHCGREPQDSIALLVSAAPGGSTGAAPTRLRTSGGLGLSAHPGRRPQPCRRPLRNSSARTRPSCVGSARY